MFYNHFIKRKLIGYNLFFLFIQIWKVQCRIIRSAIQYQRVIHFNLDPWPQNHRTITITRFVTSYHTYTVKSNIHIVHVVTSRSWTQASNRIELNKGNNPQTLTYQVCNRYDEQGIHHQTLDSDKAFFFQLI